MLDFVLQFFLWWLLFEAVFFAVRWYLNYKKINQLEKEVKTVMQDIKQNCKVVYIETVDNVHLMYDQISGNFVCQAESEDDLWQRAKLLFPNKEFIIKSESDGVPLFTFKE